jgi:Fic family protein
LVSDLGANGIQLLDHLYRQPMLDIKAAVKALRVSWPTANKLAAAFEERGVLVEVTGHHRNRVFRYSPYLALFAEPASA